MHIINLFSVVRPMPSSPFKRSLVGNLKNSNCVITNGNDGSSDSGNSGSSNSGASHSTNPTTEKSLSVKPLQINNDTAIQSGQLPAIADVRSPDVLYPKSGPCDCLNHPIPVMKVSF